MKEFESSTKNKPSSATQLYLPIKVSTEKIMTKAELIAAGAINGKYTILGESGRGGKIVNGKLIEY